MKIGRYYYDAMRVAALRHGLEVSDMVEELVERWLSDNHPDQLLKVFAYEEPSSLPVELPPVRQPISRRKPIA